MSKNGWKETRLGDIAQLVAAKSKPDAESRYIALEHINGEGSNSINGWASGSDYKSASVKFENGDILFSKLRPYLNKVWQAEFDGFATGEALVYRAFPEKVTQDFLYLILRSHDAVKYADDRSIGTRMPRIAPKIMAEFTVNVPPLDVQPEIVNFMQALDLMIQAGDREISRAEQMRGGILSTLLRDNTQSWNSVKVKEVARIVSGATPKTGKPEYWGGNIPWVTPKDLSEHPSPYTSRGARSITQEGFNSCSTHMLPKGAVLLTSRAPVGYVSIAENEICTNQGFKSLILDETQKPEFWYYLLGANTETLINYSGGSTFKELSKTSLGEIEFLLPPLEEQEKIVEKMQTLDKYIDSAKRSQEALKQVRKDALHALLSGDKDVRDLAEMFAAGEDVA